MHLKNVVSIKSPLVKALTYLFSMIECPGHLFRTISKICVVYLQLLRSQRKTEFQWVFPCKEPLEEEVKPPAM